MLDVVRPGLGGVFDLATDKGTCLQLKIALLPRQFAIIAGQNAQTVAYLVDFVNVKWKWRKQMEMSAFVISR